MTAAKAYIFVRAVFRLEQNALGTIQLDLLKSLGDLFLGFLTLFSIGQEAQHTLFRGRLKLLVLGQVGYGLHGSGFEQFGPEFLEQGMRGIHVGAGDLAVDDHRAADHVLLVLGTVLEFFHVSLQGFNHFLVFQRQLQARFGLACLYVGFDLGFQLHLLFGYVVPNGALRSRFAHGKVKILARDGILGATEIRLYFRTAFGPAAGFDTERIEGDLAGLWRYEHVKGDGTVLLSTTHDVAGLHKHVTG